MPLERVGRVSEIVVPGLPYSVSDRKLMGLDCLLAVTGEDPERTSQLCRPVVSPVELKDYHHCYYSKKLDVSLYDSL